MSWEAEPPRQTRPVTDEASQRAAINLNNHSRAVGSWADDLRQVLDSLFGTPRTAGEASKLGRRRR